MFKLLISSLLIRPQGAQGGLQIRENPQNSNFQVTDATMKFQNLQKPKTSQKWAFFYQFWLFLRGFWLLAVLKQHGRICNFKNRILWVLPDLQTPLGTLGAYQQQNELKIGSISLSVYFGKVGRFELLKILQNALKSDKML